MMEAAYLVLEGEILMTIIAVQKFFDVPMPALAIIKEHVWKTIVCVFVMINIQEWIVH